MGHVDEVADLKAENVRLRERVNLLEMAHGQLQRTLDERSARVAQLEAERDEALRDYHRISANHDHMHDRAEDAEARVAQLTQALEEACDAVHDLNNAPYKRYIGLVGRIRGLLSQPIPNAKHDDTEEK